MRPTPPGGIMLMVSTLWRRTRVGEENAHMSAEENKVVVRRLIEEVYNRGNLDIADELLAPDYVDHTWPPGKYAGREGLKRSVAKQRAASSDLHIKIEEQIAEGDKVVSWVISSGTHDRERFLGLAPTGERMTMKHIFISRVAAAPPTGEDRTRASRAGATGSEAYPASLTAQGGARSGGLADHSLLPAREVGGDFYDFLDLADGRLGVVVGDATG